MEEGLGEDNISSLLTSFTDKMTSMEGQDGNTNTDLLHMVQESSRADGEGKRVSFANAVTTDKVQTKVNFQKLELQNLESNDFELKIPVSSVMKVNDRMNKFLYGYFIGKRVVFPVVENYVFNAWGKYGIQKIVMNAKGFYFFKFSTKKGVNDVLENGPWMVRNVPIILNKWSPLACLTKENCQENQAVLKIKQVSKTKWSPAVLKLKQVSKTKPKPFKFSNFIVHKPDFKLVDRNNA
ncbi:zinc knuckle CX2CX4HX4C containing protein [Tanacetum coccineum]